MLRGWSVHVLRAARNLARPIAIREPLQVFVYPGDVELRPPSRDALLHRPGPARVALCPTLRVPPAG